MQGGKSLLLQLGDAEGVAGFEKVIDHRGWGIETAGVAIRPAQLKNNFGHESGLFLLAFVGVKTAFCSAGNGGYVLMAALKPVSGVAAFQTCSFCPSLISHTPVISWLNWPIWQLIRLQ